MDIKPHPRHRSGHGRTSSLILGSAGGHSSGQTNPREERPAYTTAGQPHGLPAIGSRARRTARGSTPPGTARRSGTSPRSSRRRARRARAPCSAFCTRRRRRAARGGGGSRCVSGRPGSRGQRLQHAPLRARRRGPTAALKCACSERSTPLERASRRRGVGRPAPSASPPRGSSRAPACAYGWPPVIVEDARRRRRAAIVPPGRAKRCVDVAREGLAARSTPSSICLALRQNGSFSSLKIRSHHVALAAEVDVRDLGLLLEDRAHQLRAGRGRCRRSPGTRRGSSATGRPRSAASWPGSSSRRSSVASTSCGLAAGVEAEADSRAVVGVDGHRRRDPQAARRRAGASRARKACEAMSSWIVSRELLGELLLRRRASSG